MKYFIVSDIHGVFDKLIKALDDAGFNKDQDTLISVGDAFDRGPQNLEVLDYLINLPNKILLFGNHCLRLKQLLDGVDFCKPYDVHNGTVNTIEDLGGIPYKTEQDIALINEADNVNGQKIRKYFDLCHYAIEFPDLYITHGWLPTKSAYHKDGYYEALDKKWKTASKRDWYNATWADTEFLINSECFPDKPILVGHWHAFRIADNCYGEHRMDNANSETVDTSMFISPDKKVIAIDGCTNIPAGRVNVYIYETDADPILY